MTWIWKKPHSIWPPVLLYFGHSKTRNFPRLADHGASQWMSGTCWRAGEKMWKAGAEPCETNSFMGKTHRFYSRLIFLRGMDIHWFLRENHGSAILKDEGWKHVYGRWLMMTHYDSRWLVMTRDDSWWLYTNGDPIGQMATELKTLRIPAGFVMNVIQKR